MHFSTLLRLALPTLAAATVLPVLEARQGDGECTTFGCPPVKNSPIPSGNKYLVDAKN